MLIAIISMFSAHAGALDVGSVPASMTFSFDWGVATGNTTFTFLDATPSNDSFICSNITGCFDGSFLTGNGGTGTYVASVYDASCVLTNTPSGGSGFVTVPDGITCDVFQDNVITYDVTGAAYDGTAYFGTVAAPAIYRCRSFGCFYRGVPDGGWNVTFDPGPYSGTLSGPGTGTFVEL